MTCVDKAVSPRKCADDSVISHRLGILCHMGEGSQAHIYGHVIPSDFGFSNDVTVSTLGVTSLCLSENF